MAEYKRGDPVRWGQSISAISESSGCRIVIPAGTVGTYDDLSPTPPVPWIRFPGRGRCLASASGMAPAGAAPAPAGRRFRTLVENPVGMDVPIGTTFAIPNGTANVVFDDPELRRKFTQYTCNYADLLVERGALEEIRRPLVPGDRVKRGPDWHWDRQDGGKGGLGTVQDQKPCGPAWDVAVLWDDVPGTSPSYAYGTNNKYDVVLAFEDDGPTTIETKKETKNESAKAGKEETMTLIQITKPTLVNGTDIKNYGPRDRSTLIEGQEAAIKRMEALEFKTQETKDEIKAARENLAAAIAEFDADYAARKAEAAAKKA